MLPEVLGSCSEGEAVPAAAGLGGKTSIETACATRVGLGNTISLTRSMAVDATLASGLAGGTGVESLSLGVMIQLGWVT